MIEHMFETGGERAAGATDVGPEVAPTSGDLAVPAPAPDPLRLLQEGAAALAGCDWEHLDHRTLLEHISSLRTVSRAVEAALAVTMATADRSAATEHVCGLSAPSWWAHSRLGFGGQGAWLVRAGELIACFEHFGAAAARGELTLDHLRSLDEVDDPAVLRELLPHDQELCREALRSPLTRWRRLLKARVAAARDELVRRAAADRAAAEQADSVPPDSSSDEPTDGDEPPEAADPHGPTCLDPSDGEQPPGGGARGQGEGSQEDGGEDGGPAPGGTITFEFPDDGAHDQPGQPDDGWVSIRPTAGDSLRLQVELRGASAELVRQILSAETSQQRRAAWREHEATASPMPDGGQLRARALVALLRRGASVDLATSAPPRTEAIVVIPADDPTAERVRALDGEPLTAEVASLLSCDAHLRALVVDRQGQPLWLGRTSRLASHSQRRALAIRDGGCVFPGCDMPAEWCDAHHQPGWEHGGTTDIDAMVLLCRRHHGAAHSKRWTLRPSPPPPPPAAAPPLASPPLPAPPLAAPPPSPRRRPSGPAPTRPPQGGGSSTGSGQHFEWFDTRRNTSLPAQQRGLTDRAA
jgi:hypothetical protein